MARDPDRIPDKRRLTRRFLACAAGFWHGESAVRAWWLTLSLVAIVVLQLVVQYGMNYWFRDFFDAFGRRDGSAVWTETLIFFSLVGASIALAIVSVWARMAAQRRWREWLSHHLIDRWLSDGHYLAPEFAAGERQSPEYRIADDARVATELPVDLAFGLLTAVLTAIVFLDVLWHIGGPLLVVVLGKPIRLPGYLVIAVVLYSAVLTTAMLAVCRRLPGAVEAKNQAEAELRSMASRLRRIDDEPRGVGKRVELLGLRAVLDKVIGRWRDVSGQLMWFTLISHANILIAPVIAWIICAPNYMRGTMTLGEVAQASAAFVSVQTALNWVVGNFQHLADWTASANRVAALLLTWDGLDDGGDSRPRGAAGAERRSGPPDGEPAG